MGPVTGEAGVARRPRAGGPGGMRDYHDRGWGDPVSGESAYLERLTLQAFPAGRLWSPVLNKRRGFREVVHGLAAGAGGAFEGADRGRLRQGRRRGRNRLKIAAAVTNARATVALREDVGLEALV